MNTMKRLLYELLEWVQWKFLTEKIVLRDISIEEAEKEILILLENNADKSFYPDEIADELKLDIHLVMDIIEKLVKEGKMEYREGDV